NMNIQFAILGSGEVWCENEIRTLQEKLPNMKAIIGYDETISHLIEAGSDFFLMPSRYEPCGLNQMYSLLYGTLPIVRNTGGLSDTVQNYDEATGNGTGFMFNELTPRAVYDTVGWAVYAYYNKKQHIKKMMIRGMKQDFSWQKSAKEYEAVYDEALRRI
ncbi:MAG: glycosyltransferase, partial [Treponema sp.]|nr:glycosyltransferase [Treponema sp.]